MKIILLTLSLLLFFLSVQAQSDFREGYVITNKGDTLRGYLNYGEGAKNFLVCEFKKTLSSESVEYKAHEIKGYRFLNDKMIISRQMTLDDNPPQRYFIEILVDGSLTLYLYRERHFVGRGDSVEHELTNTRSEIYIDGKKMIKESDKYKGILIYLTQECPSLRSRIERLNLNQKDLTLLVESFNSCVGSSVSFKSTKPWFRVIPGISVGAISTAFNYEEDRFPASYSNDFTYTIGFDLELNSPRLHEYLSFYAGLFYAKNRFFSSQEESPGVIVSRHDITMEFSQVTIPLTIRYTFPERKITPFFNVGMVPIFINVIENSWRLESERNNIIYSEDFIPFNLTKNNMGLTGGFGLKKRVGEKYRLRAEFRYELFRQIDASRIVNNSKIQNYQLLLSLSL
jgi:hypothetical protein